MLFKQLILQKTFLSNNVLKLAVAFYAKPPPFPPLNESEIEEFFANGSGPGGQKLNKTHNKCMLKHLPTGN